MTIAEGFAGFDQNFEAFFSGREAPNTSALCTTKSAGVSKVNKDPTDTIRRARA
jgi:hypothetical protein